MRADAEVSARPQGRQLGAVNAACAGRWKFAGEKMPLRLANGQRGHYAETKVSQLLKEVKDEF